MTDDLKPKPIIVCAAIRDSENFIITGARHFDDIMHGQLAMYNAFDNAPSKKWEQGFIDQFGKFHTRTEAMKIVKTGKQAFIFNAERNGGNGFDLYSEGLY